MAGHRPSKIRLGLAGALSFALCLVGFSPTGPAHADFGSAAPVDTIQETEPNDTPSTNNVVTGNCDFVGSAATGDPGFQNGEPDDIEDWVTITITEASTLTANLEVNDADLDILITHRNGPYTFHDALTHSGASGPVDEHFSIALQPGTYVIGISAYDPEGPYETTEYTLSLRGGVTTQPGRGDLSISIADSPDPAPAGTVVKYVVTATNDGPDAVPATMTAVTPANTTFSHVDLVQGGTVTAPEPLHEGTIVVSLGDVPVDGSKTAFVYLNANLDAGMRLTFRATVGSTSEDPNTANNSAEVETTIVESRVAELSWNEPAGDGAPPTGLTAALAAPGTEIVAAEQSEAAPAPGSAVTGYKVYRSNQPNVQRSPNNIFGMFPPNQTNARVPVGSGRTYFVVTACYGDQESGPSNEADVELAGPTITTIKVKGARLTATGTGFAGPVAVYVDGSAFVAPPKLKKRKKVIAKGTLANGQTLEQVMSAGAPVRIAFQNADGGMTQLLVTP
jgi:hypothetical protein